MKRSNAPPEVDGPLQCRIRTRGYVSEHWAGHWRDLQVRKMAWPDGSSECTLSGLLPDQSALIGVINYLYDLGFLILSMECTAARPETAEDGAPTDHRS